MHENLGFSLFDTQACKGLKAQFATGVRIALSLANVRVDPFLLFKKGVRMAKQKEGVYNRYAVVGFFVLIAIISFLIIKPFLITLLMGCIIAFVFYPTFKLVNRWIKHKTWSALIVSLLLILLLAVPTLFVANSVTKEAYVSYTLFKQQVITFDANLECGGEYFCSKLNQGLSYLSDPKIKFYVDDWLSNLTNWAVQKATDFIFKLPEMFLNLFIMFFVIYYLFKDGKQFVKSVKDMLPFKEKEKNLLVSRFNDVAYATVYGTLITAIIQGAIGGIGLLIFGVKSVLLWTIIMMVVALLPYFGAALVWAPIALFKIFTGLLHSDSSMMWTGIGLGLYGLIIVSNIDNFIRPKIIGEKGSIHPVIVLLGVIGGVSLLGMPGLIIGPMILALSLTAIQFYTHRNKEGW